MLVVDNVDSFVHTLVTYLRQLGAEVDVLPNGSLGDVEAAVREHDAVMISPGPGTPAAAGASIPVVHEALRSGTPLLGVCLGHQALAEALGARVGHAPELVHGMTSRIHHDGRGIYAGLPQEFEATRYHSLAVERETVPDELEVTARTESGVVMGLQHRTAPAVGVQFHPESVLTDGGYRLLGNWLESAGLRGAAERGAALTPLRTDAGATQPAQ